MNQKKTVTLNSSKYSNKLKVKEALKLYFKRSGFGKETYTSNWIKLKIGPLPIYLPNIGPRKVCVPLHDVDHILTEYPPKWRGEFQISGYELGTGVGKYWFGWFINLQALLISVLIYPKACLKGFLRGRQSGSIFKHKYDNHLLNQTIGNLRKKLPVANIEAHKGTIKDYLMYGGLLILSFLFHVSIFLSMSYMLYWTFS